MTYATEFPDFPPETMPPIPAGWTDTSWHNDTCPSFDVGRFRVFVDYADEAQREYQNVERFSVQVADDDEAEAFTTNDWQAVLREVGAA